MMRRCEDAVANSVLGVSVWQSLGSGDLIINSSLLCRTLCKSATSQLLSTHLGCTQERRAHWRTVCNMWHAVRIGFVA